MTRYLKNIDRVLMIIIIITLITITYEVMNSSHEELKLRNFYQKTYGRDMCTTPTTYINQPCLRR